MLLQSVVINAKAVFISKISHINIKYGNNAILVKTNKSGTDPKKYPTNGNVIRFADKLDATVDDTFFPTMLSGFAFNKTLLHTFSIGR